MSVTVTGTISKFEFQESQYRKAYDAALEELLFEAAAEWLRTMLTSVSGTFPVQTGRFKGTLQPISRFIRRKISNAPTVPITPAQGRPNKISEGNAEGKNFRVGVDRNQFGVSRLVFRWGHTLLYATLNEFFKVRGGVGLFGRTPWQMLPKAEEAFRTTIENGISKLPRINNYIVRTEVTL